MIVLVISGGLFSNIEEFDSLTYFPNLVLNISASLACLTISCIKSTSSTAHSICRHYRRCCINYGQPLKTVLSCPCIFWHTETYSHSGYTASSIFISSLLCIRLVSCLYENWTYLGYYSCMMPQVQHVIHHYWCHCLEGRDLLFP